MPSESPQENAFTVYGNEEVTGPPAYRAPMVEGHPVFLPYRGSEMHGVDPGQIPLIDDEDIEGGKVVTGYFEPSTADIDPVPVRIVETAVTEQSVWRAYQTYASTAPAMVVNAKSGRQNCKVRNLSDTVRVWVGPDSSISPLNGYPLDPKAEMSFTGEAPVWAVSNDATTVTLAVMTEFSTAT